MMTVSLFCLVYRPLERSNLEPMFLGSMMLLLFYWQKSGNTEYLIKNKPKQPSSAYFLPMDFIGFSVVLLCKD